MKILQLTQSLANGGAEKFVVELSNELATQHEVTLCTVQSVEKWMYPPKKIDKNVRLLELNYQKKYSLRLLIKLFSLINKEKPDIVNVHSSVLMFYFFITSFFYRKQKYIQTVHTTVTPGYQKVFNVFNQFRFINNRFVHICISKTILNEYKKNYPALKFSHIDNGIAPMQTTSELDSVKNEVADLKTNAETKVFIAIGNYSDFKNFRMLTQVFKNLEQQQNNVTLLLIGEDKSEKAINYKEVTRIKAPNTHQLGSKQNVADYLFCADAFVMSSTHEGMPLVVLEAMSLGKPIIATPAGGIPDMIKSNGIVADGFEAAHLQKAIEKYLQMPQTHKQNLSAQSINVFFKAYSITICAQKYMKIYSSDSL